ncbi:glucans biosynthesis glucosyltransferase MdoH [Coraliomargarita sp. SDUM461004]|uniref:Glucans biosynthesis glucosyltransferase H n=1 Tax=Thalassobacterium sedimentorum TaxID=3041258 RepID=A0ABU1AN73_9BACT|nr:glucans biosynthesis glucosyltransferase MdoH [Coraliomargarita sp. SDUM461004]MDQ8195216.1 glucans biosynthesis glucosyltransferase MdoH [Coraliomargarita sp. SDUM461004]
MNTATEPTTPSSHARRYVFFMTFACIVCVLTMLFGDWLYRTGLSPAKWTLLGVYIILSSGLAFGFCQSLFGFWVILRGRDPLNIKNTLPDATTDGESIHSPVALLFPIYNEDPTRFFSGIEAMYQALEEADVIKHFTFFVLSDSTSPNRWIEEERHWLQLTRKRDAKAKVIYRHRTSNINQKSGNVSDFCRRWGRHFEHMVCFDADSLMSAESLIQLVRLMEANPKVGIIQTAPRLTGAKTLFARFQQFANRIHGEISSAGLNFWQQGNGNYWGHNAIIRVRPFIEKCALPELPGRSALGGRVLSHDFVEAALMRKAGYEVWLAYDIEDSYEELPQTLLDFAQRDRRWCQGNLQHAWIALFARIPFLNRIHMLNGIYAYLAAPLWLIFIGLSTLIAYSWESSGLSLLTRPALFNFSPNSLSIHGITILSITFSLIFLPKLFTAIQVISDPNFRARFGGGARSLLSILGEVIFFTLLAPSLMLFHSAFVFATLTGKRVTWNAQNRGLSYTTWKSAFSAHIGHTLVGISWAVLAAAIDPRLFYWMCPVLIGWLLSIPLSVTSSHDDFAQWLKRKTLLAIPDEIEPSDIFKQLSIAEHAQPKVPLPIESLREDFALLQTILDPYILALHLHFLPRRKNQPIKTSEKLRNLGQRLMNEGAQALSRNEKNRILNDSSILSQLHQEIWTAPQASLPPWWRLAMSRYNRRSSFVAELSN